MALKEGQGPGRLGYLQGTEWMEGMTAVGCIGVKAQRDMEGDRGWDSGLEGPYGIDLGEGMSGWETVGAL